MRRRQSPFWEEAYWHDAAYYAIPMNDIAGQDWWVARFVTPELELAPEELFFHTCMPVPEGNVHAHTGSCPECGKNIPMEYLKKAAFIDRLYRV